MVNCEEKSYEVISSEDLLHSAKNHNREMEKIRSEIEEKIETKNKCWTCKRWRRECKTHSAREDTDNPTEDTLREEDVTYRITREIIEKDIINTARVFT